MVLVYNLLSIAFSLYSFILFVRIILSWVSVNPYNPIIRFITEISDPYLNIFRRLLPPRPGIPFDFSPIIAIFALQLISGIVLRILIVFI